MKILNISGVCRLYVFLPRVRTATRAGAEARRLDRELELESKVFCDKKGETPVSECPQKVV